MPVIESVIFRRLRKRSGCSTRRSWSRSGVYIQEFWQVDALARTEDVSAAELVRDSILGFYRMMREQRPVVTTFIEANEYESLQALQQNRQEFATAQETNFNELAKRADFLV